MATLDALKPLAIGVAYLLAQASTFVLQRVLLRFTRLTASRLDDDLVECLSSPLTLLLGVMLTYELVLKLELANAAQAFVSRGLEAAGLASLFWGGWRAVEVMHRAAIASPCGSPPPRRKSQHPAFARSLRALCHRRHRRDHGFANAWLSRHRAHRRARHRRSRGRARGAKTLEHVLGSVMLSLDRPFQVGDLINIDELTAEVESVGIRSTQLRTPDRTVVTIPNGRLADMRIENITVRDRVRLHAVIALAPNSGSAALMKFLQLLRSHMEHNDKIAPGWIVSLRGSDAGGIEHRRHRVIQDRAQRRIRDAAGALARRHHAHRR